MWSLFVIYIKLLPRAAKNLQHWKNLICKLAWNPPMLPLCGLAAYGPGWKYIKDCIAHSPLRRETDRCCHRDICYDGHRPLTLWPHLHVEVFSSVWCPFPWIDPECIKQTLLHYNCIWSASTFSHTGIKGATYHEAQIERNGKLLCVKLGAFALLRASICIHLDSHWAVNRKHGVVVRVERHFIGN